MDPITNSNIKEEIRQYNELIAKNAEMDINETYRKEMQQWATWRNRADVISVVVGICVCGLGVGWFGGIGFLVGSGVGIALCFFLKRVVDQNVSDIRSKAEKDIRNAYDEAEIRTKREISAYDNEVKASSQKILKNPDTISSMVDHVVMMFQRMVSHADAGTHMRFVEADFVFVVKKTGITFIYQSNYTNPQDDYCFNKERYRDLKSDAECEGLAEALARLTIHKMKGLYPPNSLNITVTHNDALVTLHFKAANKNFVAARDII